MKYETEDVGELLIALYSKNPETRRESVERLNAHVDERVLIRLIEHLDDKNKGVRDAMSQLLYEYSREYPQITEALLRYIFVGDIEIKNLASEIIVHIGRESLPYLKYALKCDDRDVRKFLADIMGFIQHEDAVPFLTEAFYDEDSNVGFSSIEAIGAIGSSIGLEALYKVCKDSEELRAMAIEAIGKIKDNSSINFIKSYLNDEDPMVMYSCIDALGNYTDIESYNVLEKIYSDADEMGRESIINAIIKLDESDFLESIDTIFYDDLKTLINDETFSEREKGIRLFSKVTNNNVLTDLLDLITCYQDEQEMIYNALLKHSRDKHDQISEAIKHKDGAALEVLLSLIGEIEITTASNTLIEVFPTKSNETQPMIIGTLGQLESTEAVIHFLQNQLGSENPNNVVAAIRSLGTLEVQDSFEALFNILNETENEEVAYATLEAFVSMGGEHSIEFFQGMFESDEIEDKSIAIQALATLDETITNECLHHLINSGNEVEIELAITVIQEHELREFIDPLLKVYDSCGSEIRKLILTYMLSSKEQSHEAIILKALKDDDKWVQIHALEILETSSEQLKSLLQKIEIRSMDEFAIRSLFDHLQKLVDDNKVRAYLIENVSNVSEDIQLTLLESLGARDTDKTFLKEIKTRMTVKTES